MKRRITYLTGTRADFGLMRSTLLRIASTEGLSLDVLVTGMHLSATHGMTVDEVRAAGVSLRAMVPMQAQPADGRGMALGIADCLRGVTDALAQDAPDLLLVLGDRGEMLAGAIAALHLGIPCVHVHGGERSGTVDEPVRHAISKLSAYHLVATPGSRDRLVSMGEEPGRIHVTGAPGLDGLSAEGAMPRAELLDALGFPAGARFVLALFHPVVQQAHDAGVQTAGLVQALRNLGLPVLWMEPNSDAGSGHILRALDEHALPGGSQRRAHLPRRLFASALRHCELLVGNSSAGIIEAATFATPVVNVGDRQHLRERTPNIVDVPAESAAIEAALRSALLQGRGVAANPWGDGRAGERIAELLLRLPLGNAVLQKANTF